MKINWSVLPIFAVAILGAFFLFGYRGPHEDLAFIAFFVVLFSLFFWNGWRNALLKRRLRKEGLAGTARLIRTETTGVRSGSDPELKLVLAVNGQDGQTWEASVRQIIPQSQLYAMAPGTTFSVLYDPQDRSKVVLGGQSLSSGSAAGNGPLPAETLSRVAAFTTKDSQGSPDAPGTARAYQEMMARQDAVQQRLASTGTLAPAKVVSCAPLHATMNHRDPLVMLMLEVQPDHAAVFIAQMAVCLDVTRLDRFAPGCTVYARYDPADTAQVALVGSERPA